MAFIIFVVLIIILVISINISIHLPSIPAFLVFVVSLIMLVTHVYNMNTYFKISTQKQAVTELLRDIDDQENIRFLEQDINYITDSKNNHTMDVSGVDKVIIESMLFNNNGIFFVSDAEGNRIRLNRLQKQQERIDQMNEKNKELVEKNERIWFFRRLYYTKDVELLKFIE